MLLLFEFTLSIFIVHLLVNQLTIPAKKPRFGPKAATSAWWIYRLDYDPFYKHPKYSILYSHRPCPLEEYNNLAGTGDYPPKGPTEEPFWYESIEGLPYDYFKVWAWLEATQVLGLTISEEAWEWYYATSTKHFKIQAVELLNEFFRPESKQPLSLKRLLIQDSLPSETPFIKHIELDIPDGFTKYSQLSTLNSTLKDTRYIPVTKSGERIHSKFIKQYLEERLTEYLALGGLAEVIIRSSLEVGDHKLPDSFYWDIWSNLSHLRSAYKKHRIQHFGPEEEDPLYDW